MSERYKLPDTVDNSLEAMRERLQAIQPQLGGLMTRANDLFDQLYSQAPHPSEGESTVYATRSMNRCPVEQVPMVRELTVVLGAGRWIRVFRTTDSAPDSYPRERLWYWRPEGEASLKVNVLKTHAPHRAEYPYDIETPEYDDKGLCLGFVGGADYYGKEPFIAETLMAIEEARQVAIDSNFGTQGI